MYNSTQQAASFPLSGSVGPRTSGITSGPVITSGPQVVSPYPTQYGAVSVPQTTYPYSNGYQAPVSTYQPYTGYQTTQVSTQYSQVPAQYPVATLPAQQYIPEVQATPQTTVSQGQPVKGESRIEYVPYQREVTEYVTQEVVEYVPREKKITDYYAIQYDTEYVPQVYQEKYIEYVPVEQVRERVEYTPVERQTVIQQPEGVQQYQNYQPRQVLPPQVDMNPQYLQYQPQYLPQTNFAPQQYVPQTYAPSYPQVPQPVYGGQPYLPPTYTQPQQPIFAPRQSGAPTIGLPQQSPPIGRQPAYGAPSNIFPNTSTADQNPKYQSKILLLTEKPEQRFRDEDQDEELQKIQYKQIQHCNHQIIQIILKNNKQEMFYQALSITILLLFACQVSTIEKHLTIQEARKSKEIQSGASLSTSVTASALASASASASASVSSSSVSSSSSLVQPSGPTQQQLEAVNPTTSILQRLLGPLNGRILGIGILILYLL